MNNTKRPSPECSIAQLQRTLINVTNIQTIPDNTLVVDSNLAVANCIEMNGNVCIGIIGLTGSVQPALQSSRRLSTADIYESWRNGPTNQQSSSRLRTISGPTGSFPTQNTNNILIGNEVAYRGQNTSNIAIGDHTVGGETGSVAQEAYNIAIGYNAAFNGQGYNNLALGDLTAAEGGQGEDNIAIGTQSAIGSQNSANIAIGNPATVFQNANNVAIGHYTAFEQNEGNVSIGAYAANRGQDNNAIAIGFGAATSQSFESSGVQSSNSIAIGTFAGGQALPVPEYSVQLGYQSNVISNYEPDGIFNAGVAIGPNSTSISGALVLNTDMNGLTGSGPGTFIQPVRNTYTTSSSRVLSYDTSTKEVTYGTQILSGTTGGGVSGRVYFNNDQSPFFVNIPRVVATTIFQPGSITNALYGVNISNITTSGFDYYSHLVTTEVFNAGEPFNWIAIGDTYID